jgi:hypothetical protein
MTHTLATVAPDWLRAHASPEWVERYRRHFPDDWPKGKEAQQTLAEIIGADGATLLVGIYSAQDQEWLYQIPAVEALRRVWMQNYFQVEEVRWRTEALKRKDFRQLLDSSTLLMTLMPAIAASTPVPGPATKYISLRPAMMACPT